MNEPDEREEVRKRIVDMCERAIMTIIMKTCILQSGEEQIYLISMVAQRLINSLCMDAMSKVLQQDLGIRNDLPKV